jgi:hypothetical protein
MKIVEFSWLALAVILTVGASFSAHARPEIDDGWLGLWCAADDSVAVINFGVDPLNALRSLRGQVPAARGVISPRTSLLPPRHDGACIVPSIGTVRVTTYTRPWHGISYQNSCETTLSHVAWIGPRRVLHSHALACNGYAIVVTSSMVFICSSNWAELDNTIPPLSCGPFGPPKLLGRFDSSMYAPDAAPRPRDGFSLRYSEGEGRCEAFIPWLVDEAHTLEFSVERGRLVTVRVRHNGSDPPRETGIEWQTVGPEGYRQGLRASSFHFLGGARADAVYRIDAWFSLPHRQFASTFYAIIPGRGDELDAITSDMIDALQGPTYDDARVRLVGRLRPSYELIIVDATGIADHTETDAFDVVREGGVTWTVLQRRDEWSKETLGLVLARVEKDGRQTPVCMYDRSRPPPHAQW